MTSALSSALSGMSVHQQMIDVIGNNLANTNTPGFKSSRALFASALATTLRGASSPNGGVGGRNPVQIGLGVVSASISHSLEQGALTSTGRSLDLALEGRGFFTLSDGDQRMYTRVGTFGVDADGQLVDQRTGLTVLDPQGQSVELDVNALIPPQASANISVAGNLPAVVGGPLAEVATGSTALMDGMPGVTTSSSTGPFAVPVGATFEMEVLVNGTNSMTVTVTDADADGSIPVADVVTALDAVAGISAVAVGGAVQVTTDRTGPSASVTTISGSPNDLKSLVGFAGLTSGTETNVSLTTPLNALSGNLTAYTPGDVIEVTGVDTDDTPINTVFTYGTDGTTVGDMVTFLDNLYTDAAVSLTSTGQIQIEAQSAGETNLLLGLTDGPANTGASTWAAYSPIVTTEGTGPDQVVTSGEVFDSTGVSHTLTMTFERQEDMSWTMTASVPSSEGTVLTPPLAGIQFNADGSPAGLGLAEGNVSIQLNGMLAPQTVEIDFGSDGDFEGLTQFGGQATVFVSEQDGYADGALADVTVSQTGVIEGTFTNGQIINLGAIGIATFNNPDGLLDAGANLWTETGNSGVARLGDASDQVSGSIIGGNLELSNVDTAEQFVRMIEAQRGFQANARVISTQDEVLAEVVNLI
ncbi:MAG: flagellar hook protein FlgE [Chlamydiales bacterium]|jgi:flagellar hook protein FlgE